jgi:hypothetical protein
MPGALSFETARLRLLPFRIADLDEAHRLWTDPDMRRYLWDDEIISRETAREALEVSAASFESQGFGYWRVLSKGAPALIGFAGLRTSAILRKSSCSTAFSEPGGDGAWPPRLPARCFASDSRSSAWPASSEGPTRPTPPR